MQTSSTHVINQKSNCICLISETLSLWMVQNQTSLNPIRKMQAAFTLSAPAISIVPPSKSMALPWKSKPRIQFPPCRARRTAAVPNDTSTVDYSSMNSVFPAEACETIGGEACDVEMYPEVKLKSESQSTETKTTSELYDREYLEYNSPKTVFLDEACDDLGGEFCEPEYKA